MQKYELISELGHGSFSTVWLGRDIHAKEVILKRYESGNIVEARKEYLYLQAAQQANTPRVFNFYEDDNAVWLVMEYIKGKQPSQEHFDSAETLDKWFSQLCQQVFKLHCLGICLNDLKPANIIIKNNQTYLLDFGLATPNNYNDGLFRGTLAFSSPEKLRFHNCTFAGDIFSLGMIYLTLSTGKHPSDDMSAEEWQKLLADNDKWDKWLQKQDIPEKIMDFLGWKVEERANWISAARSFNWKTEEETKFNLFIIENYCFEFQQKAATELLAKKEIIVHSLDEPERIGELTRLYGEAKGEMIIIVKEDELVEHPDRLKNRLEKILRIDLKSINELPEKKWKFTSILFLKKKSNLSFSFYERMKALPNVYFLETGNEIKAGKAAKTEISYIADVLEKNLPEDNLKNLSIVALRAALKSLLMPQSKNDVSPFLLFCSWLKSSVPLDLAAAWEKNWVEEISSGLQQGSITIDSDSFFVPDVSGINFSFNEAQKYLKIAVEHEFYYIAGIIYRQYEKMTEAQEMFYLYYRKLIGMGFTVPAGRLLNELEEIFSWHKLDFKFQKAKAYLSRQLGELNDSVNIYKNIKVQKGSREEAVLQSDMAIALQELGNFKAAAESYRKALSYFQKAGMEKAAMRTMNNLAAVYYELREYNHCASLYREIIAKTEQSSQHDYSRRYNLVAQINLADVFLHKGQWKRAHIYARNAADNASRINQDAFRLQAEAIALFALAAQKKVENLNEIINDLCREEIIAQNPALANNLQTYFLPLLQNELPSWKILENINAEQWQNFGNAALLALYYVAWQGRRNELCNNIQSCLKDELYNKICRTLFRSQVTEMKNLLRELSRQDDLLLYLGLGYELALAGWKDEEDIRNELIRLLEMQPFYPLQKLLNDDVNETPEHLELLWNIVSMIHNKVEFSEIIEELLKGIIKIANLGRAVYFRYQDGKMEAVQAIDNEGKNLPLENLRVSETVLMETLSGNEIRFFTGLQDRAELDLHSSIFGLGLRTAVCYPLRFDNSAKGVIYSDAQTDRDFTPIEQKLLESILIQGRSAYAKVLNWQKEREQELERIMTGAAESDYNLIGNSGAIKEVFNLIGLVARHNVNVLISGETGTGKELIARAIHQNYAPDKPFTAVNCAAIPENLLESELFGYKKGAFTGADRDKQGLIKTAAGGIVFLDEIGDMPHPLQAKLLRVIQEKKLTPLGSNKPEDVDVRFLAATNHDLEKAVEQGLFRQDLFYRLKVIEIKIPPLRKRSEDIPLLVHHFINRFNERFAKNIKGITAQAMAFLQNRPFPGNVRELENEIERAMVLCQKNELYLELFEKPGLKSGFSLYDKIPLLWQEYKKYKQQLNINLDEAYARKLLKATADNLTKAAEIANISRTQLYRLLKRPNKN